MDYLELYKEQKSTINEAIEFIIKDFTEIIKHKDLRIKELEEQCQSLKEENNSLKYKLENIYNDKDNRDCEINYNNLLKYFNKDSKKRVKAIIRYFIEKEDEFNRLPQNKKLSVLFISYLYKYDSHIIKKHDVFKQTQSYTVLHKLYELAKNDTEKANDGKVHNECLGKYIEVNKSKLSLENEIIKGIIQKNYKYFNNVEVIENDLNVCDKHKMMLQDKKVFIDVIDSNNDEKVMAVSVKYCCKCNKVYLLRRDLNNVTSQHKVKIKNININNFNYTIEEHKNSDISKLNTIVEKELNPQSELNKLGYSIKESRVNREKILKSKAIPLLGKMNVINHIKWLIKFNGSRSGMENAIHEWKYDLEMLKNL